MRMTRRARERSPLLPPKAKEVVMVTPRKTSEHEGCSLW